MFEIHYIYILFALLLFLTCFLKNTKAKTYLIFFSFVLIFVCSEIGADYAGYKYIYENCFNPNVHGEPLYILICQTFLKLHCSYELFRVLFLSGFLVLFLVGLYGLSDNFSLSFLLTFLMYTIYLISAYRQFATMAIFIFTLWLLLKKKKVVAPLILNFLAIFIHKLALLQFVLLVIIILFKSFKHKSNFSLKPINLKKHFIILASCILVRALLFVVLKIGFVQSLLSSYNYMSNVSLINNGLLSRLAMFVLILFMSDMCDVDESANCLIFVYYFSMLLYFAIPLELIMGRLINNFKILEVIIIANLICENKKSTSIGFQNSLQRNTQNLCNVFVMFIAATVFITQLTSQGGYVPFINYFVGRI